MRHVSSIEKNEVNVMDSCEDDEDFKNEEDDCKAHDIDMPLDSC